MDSFNFLNLLDDSNRIREICYESLRKTVEVYQCYNIETEESSNCLTLDYRKNNQSLEECTESEKFDYFTGSRLSLTLTILFIVVFILCLLILLKLLVHNKIKENERIRLKVSNLRRMTCSGNSTLVQEWVGFKEGYRNIVVVLSSKSKSIKIKLDCEGRVVRCIYIKEGKVISISSNNKNQNHFLIRVPKEYDLILKFDSYYDREKFVTKFESFLSEINLTLNRTSQELKSIFKHSYTKEKRQKHLEQFFRVVFSHVNISKSFFCLSTIIQLKYFRLLTRKPTKMLMSKLPER